jgi:hypothetical protein
MRFIHMKASVVPKLLGCYDGGVIGHISDRSTLSVYLPHYVMPLRIWSVSRVYLLPVLRNFARVLESAKRENWRLKVENIT